MRTALIPAVALLSAVLVLDPAGGQPPAGRGKTSPPPKNSPPPPAPVTPTAATSSEIAGKTLDQWIRDLDSPDPSVREEATRTVLLFGVAGRKAIPALTKQVRLFNNDLGPRTNAIFALGALVPGNPETAKETREAVDALVAALNSGQEIVKLRAALALGQIGPVARPALPQLARLIDDLSSWEVRKASAFALGTIGRAEDGTAMMAALNALIRGIDDHSKEVRIEALQSIINLGPPASGDIAAFKNLLERRLKADRDKSVVIWVRVALMRLDPAAINEANLTTIARLMKEGGDLDIRVQAARALYFIGPPAKSKIPDLIAALQSEEPGLVLQVIAALGRMGNLAEKAIPSLETLQKSHKDEVVRNMARAAIAEIQKKK